MCVFVPVCVCVWGCIKGCLLRHKRKWDELCVCVHVCFLTNKHCCWHTNYSWRGLRQGEFANYRADVCVCFVSEGECFSTGESVWVHEPNQGVSRRQLARLDLIPV